VRRRAFITLVGGAAAAWPLVARAQQAEHVRRIGLLLGVADDREGQARVTALKQGLQELGWTDGNIQVETRFGEGDASRIKSHAAELVALAPDLVVGNTTPVIRALMFIRLVQQHRVPAVHPNRSHVVQGALMSYGPDPYDMFRRSASYIDRILKGAKPADLPVQQPTKFELAINLKTAKALGLQIPDKLLAIADEVIE
jgi:ABC-type uncharacterized transport system substrate-binding protein